MRKTRCAALQDTDTWASGLRAKLPSFGGNRIPYLAVRSAHLGLRDFVLLLLTAVCRFAINPQSGMGSFCSGMDYMAFRGWDLVRTAHQQRCLLFL